MEEFIIIEFSGWIKVRKEDVKIEELDADLVEIDTSTMTAQEIVDRLKTDSMLTSFGDTFKNQVDGDFDFIFEFEVDND